ncbi:hypothetical protein SAMN04487948_10347 [Halogranum amylolyticum]|uniref:Uncharacterized protein n=1 Tax=Halogranum amylolyticum TaxID=660520 RepID=A0A1H8QDD9_9EURY|nr:hypothetical protein [Halogranum amylolyticum]SEO52066.1 hypothetical protein SAMN04487948_10347 [Halogranum amylolyticum]
MSTRYDTGDVVATPDGRGVVAAVLTEEFEFPQGTDETTSVDASDDSPAYVVGLDGSGSAVYRASALEATEFDGDVPDVEGDAETAVVNEDVNGLDDLPEGWDRESVLEYWSSIGGSWESAVDDLTDEFGEERAKQLASATKDELLRTERWRNRF